MLLVEHSAEDHLRGVAELLKLGALIGQFRVAGGVEEVLPEARVGGAVVAEAAICQRPRLRLEGQVGGFGEGGVASGRPVLIERLKEAGLKVGGALVAGNAKVEGVVFVAVLFGV